MADVSFATTPQGLAKQLGQQYNATRAELDKSQGELDASTKRIGTMKEAQAKERAPIVQKIRDKNAEATPEYTPEALPSFQPPTIDPKETSETVSTLAVLASMAGLLTNAPLASALDAFSSGVQGLVQGNEANYKKAEEKFKLDFQRAKTSNDELYRKVKQAQDKHKGDLQGLMNELTILTAEHQDAIGSEMLRRGDITGYMNKIEKQYDLFTKAASGVAKLAETANQHAEMARYRREALAARQSGAAGPTTNDPATVKMLADRYRTQGPAALTGLGYGRDAMGLRRAVLAQAAEDALKEGQTGADLASAGEGFKAESSSLRQYQNYANRLEALGGKIDKDIDTLFTVAEKGVGPTKTPLFDYWIQKGRKALGNPDVSAFETQIQTVKNEYGRAMSGPASNAQLTVSAMKHADDLINSAQNLDQLIAVVNVMRQDIKNQDEVARDKIFEIRSRMAGRPQENPARLVRLTQIGNGCATIQKMPPSSAHTLARNRNGTP